MCDRLQSGDINDISDINMPDILVRNVDPELHRALKVEAARTGLTLSDVIRRLIEAQFAGTATPNPSSDAAQTSR